MGTDQEQAQAYVGYSLENAGLVAIADVNKRTLTPPEMDSDKARVIDAEQVVTPWQVRGRVVDGCCEKIDYAKLMHQFGCQPIDTALIARLERATGMAAHPLLRRGFFYCHR